MTRGFRISAAKIVVELKAVCQAGQAAQALGELCAEMEQASKQGWRGRALTALLSRFETERAAVDEQLEWRGRTGGACDN